MENDCSYGFGRCFEEGFDSLVARVGQQLEERGFRIYSRIDLRRHLEEALDITFRPYVILGACRADFAFQAFTADPNIGMLLPCNVVVYAREDGRTAVMIQDPARIMDLVRAPQAIEAAMKVREELEGMVEGL